MVTKLLRKYPLSLVLIILIWFLCLWTPPKMELGEVPFIDKWTHLVMYGGFCLVIWFEYLRRHQEINGKKIWYWAILSPVIMSGVIELCQAYCTTTRSGEWLDLAANTLGVILGNCLGYFVLRPLLWRRK